MSTHDLRSRLWPWLIGYAVVGLAVGLFSSWYVYHTFVSWIPVFLTVVFLVGGWVSWRRVARPGAKAIRP